MRFLVDECVGPVVARWLRSESHDVYSVFDESRGMSDDNVLTKAHAENRILITNDKDFGEMVHRDHKPHCGIVLLRLQDERAAAKIEALEKLIAGHADQLPDAFCVVTEKLIRIG